VPGFVGDALGLLLMIGPIRHLVIRISGVRLARRVGTMRTVRWRVIDADSRPADEDFQYRSGALEPPRRSQESPDR